MCRLFYLLIHAFTTPVCASLFVDQYEKSDLYLLTAEAYSHTIDTQTKKCILAFASLALPKNDYQLDCYDPELYNYGLYPEQLDSHPLELYVIDFDTLEQCEQAINLFPVSPNNPKIKISSKNINPFLNFLADLNLDIEFDQHGLALSKSEIVNGPNEKNLLKFQSDNIVFSNAFKMHFTINIPENRENNDNTEKAYISDISLNHSAYKRDKVLFSSDDIDSVNFFVEEIKKYMGDMDFYKTKQKSTNGNNNANNVDTNNSNNGISNKDTGNKSKNKLFIFKILLVIGLGLLALVGIILMVRRKQAAGIKNKKAIKKKKN